MFTVMRFGNNHSMSKSKVLFNVKRASMLALLLSLLVSASALSEQTTPTQFLESKGYAVYSVGSVSDIGIDEAVFSGDNAKYSLCGCIHYTKNDSYGFFWRESDGSVYVAQSAVQSLFGSFSPVLGGLGVIGTFVDMCETCNFDLGLFIDGTHFIFCMPQEDAALVDVSKRIAGGYPWLYRVGWENYAVAITLPGVY